MTEFSYSGIDECFKLLKLDMTVAELATLAQEERFNETQLGSVKRVLEYLPRFLSNEHEAVVLTEDMSCSLVKFLTGETDMLPESLP